jgi:hypothetical protein
LEEKTNKEERNETHLPEDSSERGFSVRFVCISFFSEYFSLNREKKSEIRERERKKTRETFK